MAESTTQAATKVGLIYPPPDIKAVVDKTAQFVAKCGPEFESRVLKEQNSSKFAFLLAGNPYRAYYDHKVKEFQSGNVTDSKPEVPKAIADMKAKAEEKKRKKDALKMLTYGERKEAKEPAKDVYTVPQPFVSALDQDIIKVTAQFVARNGKKFLVSLTQRESRNPQFDFLKPTHHLFPFFTGLVDAYTRVLIPDKELRKRLEKEAESWSQLWERGEERFRWDVQEAEKKERQDKIDEKEREQMRQIDWHDFIPVETVMFNAEDDAMQLNPPIDPKTRFPKGLPEMLAQQEEEDRMLRSNEVVAEEEAMEIEMDVGDEMEIDEPPAAAPAEPEAPADTEEAEEATEEAEQADEEMKGSEEEEEKSEEPIPISIAPEPQQMTIRKDYVRKRKGEAAAGSGAGGNLVKCPITGQLVPQDEMSNHLKILLLDPKWKEQRDLVLERYKKDNAFADDVEANLSHFVARRPDLFGSVEEQIAEAKVAGLEAGQREAGADAGPAHTVYNPEAMRSGKFEIQGAGSAQALEAGQMALPPSMSALPGRSGAMALENDSDSEAEAPPAKVLKTGEVLNVMSEQNFLENNPGEQLYIVQVLTNPAEAKTVQISMPCGESVNSLKVKVAEHVPGVAMTRMRIKAQATGQTLRDSNTLAFYNLGNGTVLEVSLRERGGRARR